MDLRVEASELLGQIGEIDFAQHFNKRFGAHLTRVWILHLLPQRAEDQVGLLRHEHDLLARRTPDASTTKAPKAGDRPHERGLAGAGWPAQQEPVALANRKRDILLQRP